MDKQMRSKSRAIVSELFRGQQEQHQQQQQQQQQLGYGKRETDEGGDAVGVLEAGQQEIENGAIVKSSSIEAVAITVSSNHGNDASATYELHSLDYHDPVLRER